MTSSYEELTTDSREQVDAFMHNLEHAMYLHDHRDYIRERVSNLVQTCIYLTKKKDNKAVILTSREWKSLSRAFLNLYNILTDFPTYLGDYFIDRKNEFREVEEWEERLSQPLPPINKRGGR